MLGPRRPPDARAWPGDRRYQRPPQDGACGAGAGNVRVARRFESRAHEPLRLRRPPTDRNPPGSLRCTRTASVHRLRVSSGAHDDRSLQELQFQSGGNSAGKRLGQSLQHQAGQGPPAFRHGGRRPSPRIRGPPRGEIRAKGQRSVARKGSGRFGPRPLAGGQGPARRSRDRESIGSSASPRRRVPCGVALARGGPGARIRHALRSTASGQFRRPHIPSGHGGPV
jgi:hypothetical protein